MGFAPLAISAATSLMQASQKQKAGEIQKKESELAASQIELGAVQREADRKNLLARAIASQNAEAGARGIAAFEGSPLSVIESDIKRAETASQRDIFQSDLAALTTRTRGTIARQSARQGAFLGLVGDFSKLAKTA